MYPLVLFAIIVNLTCTGRALDYAKFFADDRYSTMKMVLEKTVALANSIAGQKATPAAAGSATPMSEWDVRETVAYLRANGFDSYADHFLEEGYNGLILENVEESDIQDMPSRISQPRSGSQDLEARIW